MEESKEELLKYLKQLKSNLDFINFLIDSTNFKYCRETFVKKDTYIIDIITENVDEDDNNEVITPYCPSDFIQMILDHSIIIDLLPFTIEIPSNSRTAWVELEGVKPAIKDEIKRIENKDNIKILDDNTRIIKKSSNLHGADTLVSDYLHVAPRCSGKTTQLVITSNMTQYPIVCFSSNTKKSIEYIVAKLNVQIPEPITFAELKDGIRGRYRNPPKVLIDDGEIAIKEALNKYYGIDVVAVTVSLGDDPKC